MRTNGTSEKNRTALWAVASAIALFAFSARAATESPEAPVVECATGAVCSPSVALVEVIGAGQGGQPTACLGFVVDKQAALMSRHCLAPTARRRRASCAGRVRFYFPAAQEWASELAECESVIDLAPGPSASRGEDPDDPYLVDWALVRLKAPVSRPPVPLSFEGVPDGTRALAMKLVLEVADGVRRATIVPVECVAVQKSAANPLFVSDLSPTIGLPSCRLPGGASGGPVLDEAGRARAVVSASFEVEGRRPYAVATNLACVRSTADALLAGGGAVDSACRARQGLAAREDAFLDLFREAAELDPLARHLERARGASSFALREIEALPAPSASRLDLRHPLEPSCLIPQAIDMTLAGPQRVTAPFGSVHQTFDWDNEREKVTVLYSDETVQHQAFVRAFQFASGRTAEVRFRPTTPARGGTTLVRRLKLCAE